MLLTFLREREGLWAGSYRFRALGIANIVTIFTPSVFRTNLVLLTNCKYHCVKEKEDVSLKVRIFETLIFEGLTVVSQPFLFGSNWFVFKELKTDLFEEHYTQLRGSITSQ